MNKKKEIVPKLRFPKYVNSEQWISTELSSLLDYERPDLYIVESDNYKNEGIPVLTANKSFILGYTDEKNNIYSRVPAIIFDDFTTEKKYVDFPFKVKSSAIKILKPKGNNVLKFIFELMNTINFEAKEHKRYYISTYQKLFVCVPKDVKEQQKIADCLSSIDELINAESKKLKALEKYKKGLMQKLFPAEGKTLPEWRFPEFQGCGEWKSKSIEKACKMFSGGTPDTSKKEFYGGTIPFIRSAEINKSSTELFITEEGFKNSSAKMVKKGDILIALYGANSGEVALSKIDGAINQAILCLRHETNNVFVYHYFTHMKNWIISKYIQGGQGNLSGQIIKSVNLYFPKAEEQQKIADCLSEIDKIITEQSNKVEQLKKHKKGLMQGLFPSLEEVDV
ncbi:TPA: restriction endonuclease subunit S [Campylobacter coli]|nr:restriction endonuclease subunit S [Campylobacter coli]HEB9354898.1 restriction endonuclease subunit S [Campylobacter coli]HEB9430383.1 restriction endonuclease subunit S [Campylobacter coli]